MQMTSRLAIMLGGRVAEEMVCSVRRKSRAGRFRHRAGDQARPPDGHALGLSVQARHRAYGEKPGRGVPRYQVSRQQNISEATAQTIDAEVRKLVEAGYAEATQVLTDKRADLEVLARACSNLRR